MRLGNKTRTGAVPAGNTRVKEILSGMPGSGRLTWLFSRLFQKSGFRRIMETMQIRKVRNGL